MPPQTIRDRIAGSRLAGQTGFGMIKGGFQAIRTAAPTVPGVRNARNNFRAKRGLAPLPSDDVSDSSTSPSVTQARTVQLPGASPSSLIQATPPSLAPTPVRKKVKVTGVLGG